MLFSEFIAFCRVKSFGFEEGFQSLLQIREEFNSSLNREGIRKPFSKLRKGHQVGIAYEQRSSTLDLL